MWVIGRFALLSILVAPNIQGQFSPTLHEPNEYTTAVVDALWVKIKEYGISNLPVPDVTLTYDVTSFGVELIGPVSFEDGFVQDIGLVYSSNAHIENSVSTTLASVRTRILFQDLRLFRDIRADLNTGMKIATCVITPSIFAYDMILSKAHGNDTVVPHLSFAQVSVLNWDIDPDDIVTRMIRRQSLVSSSITAGTTSNLVFTTGTAWEPLLRKFLQEIVDTMEFPALVF